MSLTFEQLKASKPMSVTVEVPDWGGQVTLKKWSAMDKLRFLEYQEKFEKNADNQIVHTKDAMDASAEMLAMSIIDIEGNLAFDSDDAREFLRTEDPRIVQPLVDAVITLNRLGVTLEGDLDSAKKN